MSFINRRMLPLVLLCALTFSLLAVSPAIPKAHAVAPTALSIKPTVTPLAANGATVILQVNVTNVVSTSGIDIYVSLGASAVSVLNPVSDTLGTAIPSPFTTSNCISNGAIAGFAAGCDANDGPGIVHIAYASLTGGSAAGNFTLFTISYTAVNTPPATGTTVFFKGTTGNPETVTINNGLNSLFDSSGFNETGIPMQQATYGTVAQPSFTVSAGAVSPASILATNSGTSTITVSSLAGFSGSVSLTANPSSGLSCAAIPSVNVPSGGSAISTLSCSAATGADYTATVTGTGGSPTQTKVSNSVTFHVVDFSISCAPVTTLATVTGTTTCVVAAINGFTGTVAFVLSSGFIPPAGCTVTSSGATVSVVCPTAPAPFTVPVTGTTGTAPTTLSRSTSFLATIQDFTPSCPGITTLATVAGSSTCGFTGINGFSGTVTWAVSSGFTFPTGCNGSFTGTVLSVTCSTGVTPFTVPVTGTSGGLSRSTTVSVTVQDFSIAGPPITTLATVPGTSTVAVTSINGFSGAVTFAVSSGFTFPTGCNGSFSLAVLSVTCATGVAPFSVPITGTSGGLSRSTTVPVTVQDFSIAGTAITTLASVAGTSTVVVTPINGFTGAVTFAITAGFAFPTGCSGSFTGSTLSVTCANGPAPFSVPVTGTTGAAPNTLSRSTSVSVTVQDFSIAGPAITTLATVAGTSTVAVTSINGFSGAVTFAISSGFTFPTGCNGSFTGAVLSVTCATGVAPFTVPVTGSSGGLSRSTTVSVTVRDFTLSAPGITLTTAGTAGTSQITVNAINSFTGTINYAITSTQPAGCTATVSAAGLISVSCSPLPSSSFTVTVTGTAASATTLVRSVNGAAGVSVSVGADFSVSLGAVAPTSILATNSGSSTVTVTGIGTFTGTVALTANPSAGLLCQPVASVTIATAGGSGTSTLTCSAATGADYTATVTGASGTLSHTSTPPVTFHVVDFTVVATPSTLNVVVGTPKTSALSFTAINGFTGTVTFSTSASPTSSCTATVSGTTLSVSCTAVPSPSSFMLTITGTTGASPTTLSRTTLVSVTVGAAPTFTVALGAVTPASILATNSGSSTITVTSVNGFVGPVSLTASPSTGLSCNTITGVSLTAGGTATSTLTCTAATGADYTATVTGSGGTPVQNIQSNTVTFHVVDFSVTCNPSTLNVVLGTPQTCTLSFTAINGFSGTVAFSTSAAPTGCTASVSGAILTVSCTAIPSPASFTLTITGTTGTSPTTLSRTTSVTVNVTQSSFTVTLGPVSPSSILATNSGSSTVTVTSIGTFTGVVALTANPSTGLICQPVVSVTITTAGSSGMSTLTCSAATGADYTAFVTGVGGTPSQSHSSNTVTFHVVDFSVAANPNSLSVTTGTSKTSTLSFTAINGFSGTVTFSTSAALTGCTAAVSGTTLTVGCTAVPSPASFTLTITGTTGTAPTTLSRTGSVAVSVSPPAADFMITSSRTSIGPLVTSFQDPDGTPEGPLVGETTITITAINGFTGTVTISLTTPANLDAVLGTTTLTFLPGNVTLSTTLDVDSAAAANYSEMVTASSAGFTSKSLNVAVVVVDFGITASPSIGPLVPASGQRGSSPYTITGQTGAAAVLSLTVTDQCVFVPSLGFCTYPSSGTDGAGNPGSCTLSASSVTCNGFLNVTAPNIHGPFLLAFHATASAFAVNKGDLGTGTVIVDRLANVTLHVPDFDLLASPANIGPILTGPPGATTSIIVAARDGFSGTVNFNLVVQNGTSLPTTGLTATISGSLTFTPALSPCTSSSGSVVFVGLGCPRFLIATLTVVANQLGEYHVIVTGLSAPYPSHIVGPNGFVFVSTPKLVVFIIPVSPTLPASADLAYQVRVISMESFSGFDISVKLGTPGVLVPDSIDSIGDIIPGFFEQVDCVNGGFHADGTAIPLNMPGNLGCFTTGADGPGIAHLSGTSATGGAVAGDGLLFTVHYKVGPGAAFTITASPNTVSIPCGGSTTSTITISTNSFTNLQIFAETVSDPNGFTIDHGTRTGLYGGFSTSLQVAAGSGLSASILPTSLSLDTFNNPVSAVLSISGTKAGAVSISAVPNASSGLASQLTMVNVVITTGCQSFTVQVTPNTLYIDGDDVRTATSAILVTSVQSFAGTVCLSQTGGDVLSPIISPTCVTVTAGGQATATITVSAIEGQTPPGTYNIVITGSSPGVPSASASLKVIVASNTVKFNLQSEGTTVNPQTWVATLTNRHGTTTEYAMVQITVRSLTAGTQPITLTSQVVQLAPGATVTFNISHTFTVGQRYQWNAILLFGTNQSNLDQVAIPFRQGQFTVTP